MKKIIVLQILIIVFGFTLNAQNPVTGCAKVIYHSFQVVDTLCDPDIKNVGITCFSNKLMIKYWTKHKRLISEDSVWGIRRKNDYPERLFKKNYYQLYQLSPVYKYSKRVGRSTRFYFSVTLDSPIFLFTEKLLKQNLDSTTYSIIANDASKDRHEMSFNFYSLNTRLLSKAFWGCGFDIKYYPSQKWGTGIYLAFAGRKTIDSFSFPITKPYVSYLELGWLNQYDLIQSNNFRVGINIVNGIAISELFDNNQKVRVWTRYGYKNESKKIASNFYYLLEPGVDFSLKLFSNNHNPDFYLTAQSKYRLVFGNSTFSSTDQHHGYLFAIGVSLIGFDKEQFSQW